MNPDIEAGRQALTYFHNASLRYPAYGGLSFDELLGVYGNKRDIYLEGVGMVINVNGMDDNRVQIAMQNLATKSQGKIPKDHQGYVNSLGNVAAQISYIDLTKTVAKDVGTAVVDGAQAVGDNVVSTLKILNYVWPLALFYFIWSYYKEYLPKETSTKTRKPKKS